MKKLLLLASAALCMLSASAELTTATTEVIPEIQGYTVTRITDPDQLAAGDQVLIRIHNALTTPDQFIALNASNEYLGTNWDDIADLSKALFTVAVDEEAGNLSYTAPSPYTFAKEGTTRYQFKQGDSYLPLGNSIAPSATAFSAARLVKVTNLPACTNVTGYNFDAEANSNGFFLMQYTTTNFAYCYQPASGTYSGKFGFTSAIGTANAIYYNGLQNGAANSNASFKSTKLTPFFILYKVEKTPTAWVAVTSADQLEAGARYKVIAHCNAAAYNGDAILTHVNNNTQSQWLKLNETTEAAEEAIWTFEEATNNCSVSGHATTNKGFYLKNNGRYYTKSPNGTSYVNALNIATVETPGTYGAVVEFLPFTNHLASEGLYTWGIHVRVSAAATVALAIKNDGTQDQLTEKTTTYTEWYGTSNYTSVFLLYKEIEIKDPHQPYEQFYKDAKGQLALSRNLGEKLGQYNFSNGTTLAQWQAFPEELEAIWTAEEFDAEAFTAKCDQIREAYNSVGLNMPASGSLIRIKASPANPAHDNATVHYSTETCIFSFKGIDYPLTKADAATATDENSIFYYKDEALLTLCNGFYMYRNTANSNHVAFQTSAESNTSSQVRFLDATAAEVGAYQMVLDSSEAIHIHASDYEYAINRCTLAYPNVKMGDANHNLAIEEVTEVPVAVHPTNHMGSVVCPVALDVPEGVTAWVAVMNGSVISWDAATHIKANEHAVFYAPNAVDGKVKFPVSENQLAAEEDTDHEYLRGHHVARTHDTATFAHLYMFDVNAVATTDELGEEESSEAEAMPTSVTLSQVSSTGAVALPASTFIVNATSPDAKDATMVLPFGESVDLASVDTSLEEIAAPEGSAAVYDLMGRRLAAPVRGAINIINGHKTLVR